MKCLAIEANALAAALCGRKQDLQEWKDEVFRIEKRIEDSSNQKDWMELELLEVKLEVKETRKLCRDVKMQRDTKQEELEAAMEELRALQEQELIASQQYLADASATE